MKHSKIFAASILAVAMSACGSSGGSGSGSGSGSGVSLDSSTLGGVISTTKSAEDFGNLAKAMGTSAGAYGVEGGVSKSTGGVSPQAQQSCPDGGTVDFSSSGGSVSLTYAQCTYDLSGGSKDPLLVMDGGMTMDYTDSYNWSMSMPSFSFTVTGSQSFDMSISNYTITSSGTSSHYTMDYGMTVDSSTLNGGFSVDTTSPLVFDSGAMYNTVYPSGGSLHISADGTADIDYYDGGFTVTYSGGTVDCSGYVCPSF
jgi:uncharacterized protein YaiE (UPF0345 family)